MMFEELMEIYRNSSNKLILLDYDGTLVGHINDAKKAYPSERVVKILARLSTAPKIKVVIVTGRHQRDIDEFVGHLPIDIVAEHGAIRKQGITWSADDKNSTFWKNRISPILYNATLQCPESSIEEKDYSLTWHYRKSEPELGYSCSRELIRTLEGVVGKHNLKILDGHKVVEIMSNDIGKGKAVKKLVREKKYDFILSIGDDRTDEEMFKFLLPFKHATTIKVGSGETSAKYKLDNVESVIGFLEKVSNIEST